MRMADCHPEKKHYCRGMCVRCYSAMRKREDPARTLAGTQKWYRENTDKARAKNRDRYHAQPAVRARIQDRSREWARQHPEEARARKRAWYRANQERARAKLRQEAATRRASCAGLTRHPATPAERMALVAPGVQCFYCHAAQAKHVDHFIPLARWAKVVLTAEQRAEGPDHINNLVGACAACNGSKGARLPDDEWQGRK